MTVICRGKRNTDPITQMPRTTMPNVSVENRFNPRGKLPDAHVIRPHGRQFFRAENDWLNPEMSCQKIRTSGVKLFCYQSEFGLPENFAGTFHRIERPQSGIIKRHG
jgi:hypothetical protein